MSPLSKRRDIKVFLVDDHPVVREGVRSYLANHSIVIVGEASDAKEALRKVKKAAPDVLVLDVNLPVVDGSELARRLRVEVPSVKLLAFSIHSSVEYVLKMARSGVQGYVTKDQPAGELLAAINNVFEGRLHFPPGMHDALLNPAPGPAAAGKAGLTSREQQVLTLLAEGFSNKRIAANLGISVRTAETHRKNLSQKLGIFTVAGLTKYALSHQLTAL